MEQVPQAEFTPDERQGDLRPAAVELDVQGEISGVAVRGRVDVLDVEGRLITFAPVESRGDARK